MPAIWWGMAHPRDRVPAGPEPMARLQGRTRRRAILALAVGNPASPGYNVIEIAA
ncbi:MAG: hypothetical protein AB7H90_17575 [Alphaproteobacteria bacterium]